MGDEFRKHHKKLTKDLFQRGSVIEYESALANVKNVPDKFVI